MTELEDNDNKIILEEYFWHGHKYTIKKKACPDCGKHIRNCSKFCVTCSKKGSRNPFWKEEGKCKSKLISFCKTCGKKIVYHPSNKSGIYCSQKCYDKHGEHNPKYGKGDKMMGDNNPNWRGGHRVKSYRGWNWRTIRLAVLQRDNYICQKCGRKDKLVVHHLNPWKISKDNSLTNLETRCRYCHAEEGKWEFQNA